MDTKQRLLGHAALDAVRACGGVLAPTIGTCVPGAALRVTSAATLERNVSVSGNLHASDIYARPGVDRISLHGESHVLGGLHVSDVYPLAGGTVNVHAGLRVVADGRVAFPSGVSTGELHALDDGSPISIASGLRVGADLTCLADAYLGVVGAPPGVGVVTFTSPVVFLAGCSGPGASVGSDPAPVTERVRALEDALGRAEARLDALEAGRGA